MQSTGLPRYAAKPIVLVCAALASFAYLSCASYAQSGGGFRRPSEMPQPDQTNSSAQQQLNQAVQVAQMKGAVSSRPTPSPDATRLAQNADELAKLAQSIPASVDQTTKGLLPKDLDERLKRIEKLAKQLRSEISH